MANQQPQNANLQTQQQQQAGERQMDQKQQKGPGQSGKPANPQRRDQH